METPQKKQSPRVVFIDYVPAEVKETTGEAWRIVFYVKKPGTNQMKRFRRRVRKIRDQEQFLGF